MAQQQQHPLTGLIQGLIERHTLVGVSRRSGVSRQTLSSMRDGSEPSSGIIGKFINASLLDSEIVFTVMYEHLPRNPSISWIVADRAAWLLAVRYASGVTMQQWCQDFYDFAYREFPHACLKNPDGTVDIRQPDAMRYVMDTWEKSGWSDTSTRTQILEAFLANKGYALSQRLNTSRYPDTEHSANMAAAEGILRAVLAEVPPECLSRAPSGAPSAAQRVLEEVIRCLSAGGCVELHGPDGNRLASFPGWGP